MESAVTLRILKYLAMMLTVPAVFLQAEERGRDAQKVGRSEKESAYFTPAFRNYSEFALYLYSCRDANRGLGYAVDPDEYLVGPGDQFGIYFSSDAIDDIIARVGTDGDLFITSIGSVPINGLNLRKATDVIREALGKHYSGIAFDVQLTDCRQIPISVYGEVMRPGIYHGPAIWRVSEIIDLAGGLKPNASAGNITLHGEHGEISVDLVRFNASGNPKVNPYIAGGNRITVPGRQAIEEMIVISGLVNNPGVFAARDDERIADCIAYGGGPRGDLEDMMVVIASGKASPPKRLDGADPATLKVTPAPGDNITLIRKDGHKKPGAVTVFGEVVRPGIYSLDSDGFSLSDLLVRCGGITSEGCPEMIQIHRLVWRDHFEKSKEFSANPVTPNGGESFSESPKNWLSSGMISYNPRQPLDQSRLALIDGDSIYVPRATGMVAVTGAVAAPGLVRFERGKGVEYYLRQAGGLGYGADREKMVVINPVTGGRIAAAKAGELFDGETLYVPRKENGNGL